MNPDDRNERIARIEIPHDIVDILSRDGKSPREAHLLLGGSVHYRDAQGRLVEETAAGEMEVAVESERPNVALASHDNGIGIE
jgi:hypothetical protein